MASRIIDSPVGFLFVATSVRGVTDVSFLGYCELSERDEAGAGLALLDAACSQLDDYFAGRRRDFDLPLDLQGSEFRQRVWRAIAGIPFGETITYAELAVAAGSPGAYRAAGAACGANRVGIIVPCHRVVGSDGALHGFGGSIATKTWLLSHEDALPSRRQPVLAFA